MYLADGCADWNVLWVTDVEKRLSAPQTAPCLGGYLGADASGFTATERDWGFLLCGLGHCLLVSDDRICAQFG
jgi:hypothetical protein